MPIDHLQYSYVIESPFIGVEVGVTPPGTNKGIADIVAVRRKLEVDCAADRGCAAIIFDGAITRARNVVDFLFQFTIAVQLTAPEPSVGQHTLELKE